MRLTINWMLPMLDVLIVLSKALLLALAVLVGFAFNVHMLAAIFSEKPERSTAFVRFTVLFFAFLIAVLAYFIVV